jgi:hypothetical protein
MIFTISNDTCNILVGKPKSKRPLGRHRPRWEDTIRMDIREDVDWLRLTQDREQWRVVVNTVMNFRIA